MNLPADVAALLREALVEARRQPYAYGSYCLLADTIDNLLTPLPEAPDEGDTHCEDCEQLWEHCQCLAHGAEEENEVPTCEELWGAYNKSKDEKDLPF